ncbi:MAG: DNA translocase FtsK [Candidatus Levybacteria bacterium]|nr:DNA translocase FtsK [Candidatus Levybacteria bacterium]
MAKKRGSYGKRGKFKIKLKTKTVYTIFALGQIVAGLLLLLSFSNSGETFIYINTFIRQYFGPFSFFLGFVFILFGFLFFKTKFALSRPNVAIGFLILFGSAVVLFRSGYIGQLMFANISDVITPIGTLLVFLAGIFIGLVVLFDTSVDEILKGLSAFRKTGGKVVPTGFLKKQKDPLLNKQMTIKDSSFNKNGPMIMSNSVKKDEALMSEKLVSNTLSSGLIWEYPPLDLLEDGEGGKADRGDVKATAAKIEETLQSFGIIAKVVEVNLGPAVTQYALEIALGTKVSKITSLANDLALNTQAPTGQIRIEAPIPGRNLVGIEIPNKSLEVVTLRTMLSSDLMRKSKSKLSVSLGLDVSGSPLIADIGKMPHVLVAGTTGSGKSVLVNSFITSLLFRASPEEVKLILIDPKRVELTGYNGIPHLMIPVIVEVEKILSALKWATNEMDRRYKTFAERGVRNIDGYNELAGFQALPYIIIFIDELADLMMFAPVEVEDTIARLAQMARATGIHLVIATQRPSVDVITGLIKANVPCRIAFSVSSMIDSRVIIDGPGAEKLLGRGDMLYIPPDQAKPTRIQGAFVSDKEVKKLVEFLKSKSPAVEYTEEIISTPYTPKGSIGTSGADGKDPVFAEAVRVICEYDKASASLLQRRLSIGYSRAARILDQLEAAGIVGRAEGSKPRDVLIKDPSQILGEPQSE